MRVVVPGALRSYTGTDEVDADGETLAALLDDLDAHYPGLRFRIVDEQDRIRRHIRFFVNGVQHFDLAMPVGPDDELFIVQALSGG
jgi:molybdopterin converting factor small subunit